MNVDKLEGAELDAAVARAAGLFIHGMERRPYSEGSAMFVLLIGDGSSPNLLGLPEIWTPSRSWTHGGPIIERERIAITCHAWGGSAYLPSGAEAWVAKTLGAIPKPGPTPLIAAMRAFVAASKKT